MPGATPPDGIEHTARQDARPETEGAAPDVDLTATEAAAPDVDLTEVLAERDALARRVEELEDRPTKRRRFRRIGAVILLILSVLLFAVSVPATWARRTLTDTDRYVATVGPLADDPAVQSYLARTVTTSLFDALDVETRLDTALSERAPRLVFLAGPVAGAVQGFIEDRMLSLFQSEAFSSYWVRANRFVHGQLIAALEGEGGTLVVSDGRVILDLLPLVNRGITAVADVIGQLLGRTIELPELTGREVPVEAVARIEAALGIDLPERFGTIVVYDSDELAAVQDAVNLASRSITLLVAALILVLIAALWASTSRRRTLIQLMTAFVVVLVVERRFAITAANDIVDSARAENADAARAVVDQVLGSLLSFTAWLLAIAIVVLIVSLVTGPYPWAVRIRRWVADVGSAAAGTARGGATGPAAPWIAAHRGPLLIGGVAVFAIGVLLLDLSLAGLFVAALALAAYVLAINRIAATATQAAEIGIGQNHPANQRQEVTP
jgi:hypothetical protein